MIRYDRFEKWLYGYVIHLYKFSGYVGKIAHKGILILLIIFILTFCILIIGMHIFYTQLITHQRN